MEDLDSDQILTYNIEVSSTSILDFDLDLVDNSQTRQATLDLTHIPDQYGVVSVTINVTDNAFYPASENISFDITILSVNDQPTFNFTSAKKQVVYEDCAYNVLSTV